MPTPISAIATGNGSSHHARVDPHVVAQPGAHACDPAIVGLAQEAAGARSFRLAP